jgi:long-chain fatty acid transport protein
VIQRRMTDAAAMSEACAASEACAVSVAPRKPSALATAPWLCCGLYAALALSPSLAHASGFHIDEQDARSTGRAGAVTADPGGAAAVYFNPAAIATLNGVDVELGASWVTPSAKFQSADTGETTKARTQNFVLPQLFASWRASELLAIGVGVYSPFGLALDWPATSPGRASVRQAELRTFFLTPVVALNFSRWVPGLAVGAGLELVPASVRLTRDVPFGVDTGSAALSGEAFGIGGHAGIYFHPRPLPQWSFGVTYRSAVKLNFDGQANFGAPSLYRASLPPDGDVQTSITLPQSVNAGIAFAPTPEWKLELDGSWIGWSSYDRLDVHLPDGSVQSSFRDWKDSLTARLGSEYTFDERWTVRVGAIWDETPIPRSTLDFQLPDANRIDLTVGFGAQLSRIFQLDVGALYVLPEKRSTGTAPYEPPVKGRFTVDAWVFGLTLGIRLEADPNPPLAGDATALDGEGRSALPDECRVRANQHLAVCR